MDNDLSLKAITDASPVGIVVFDGNGNVVYANVLAERLFGKSVDTQGVQRWGDWIACAHRHSDPGGCGHTENCPACPLFRAIRNAVEQAPGAAVIEGDALLDRETELPTLRVRYKVNGTVINGKRAAVMAFEDITDRKRTEDVAQDSDKKYRDIFEDAPIGIFQTTSEGRFLSVNPEYARLAGYSSPSEMIEQITDIAAQLYVRPEERIRYKELLKRKRRLINFEIELKRRDGSTFWASFNTKALQNPDGTFVYDGFLVDISDRVLAEQALGKERERLAYIIEGTNVGTWEWNVQTGETVFNERWAEIIGYTLDEIAPVSIKTWIRFSHPEDLQQSEALLAKHFTGELDYYECECRMRHRDGTWVWVLDRGKVSQWNTDGQPLMMSGTHQDITNRKRAEVALRESEERFQKAFIASPAPLVIAEIDTGRIIDVNDRWIRMIGYDRQEQIGRTSTELGMWMNPGVRDRFVRKLEVHGRFKNEPVEFRNKTGRTVHALWSAELVTMAGKKVILGMLYDESERKAHEKERAKLQQQLTQAQKMESIGRLAGGVAHDYNNMLSIIVGYTEMLMEKVRPENPLHADLIGILKAAQRSSDITRQLLAFARKQTIDPKVIDLNAVVESMLRMLRRLIGEDIDLAWLPARRLWTVKIDPSQIDQILANLCVNARDAIGGVGKVTIETANISIDSAYCEIHQGFMPGDFLMLAVSDNGRGMDEEIREKIFEPFFSTKGLTEGTGLGLATVYGIVKQNNGFINVYSEPGKGTIFKIYLPRHIGDVPRMIAANRTLTPKGNGETLLLVEDEPSILQMAEIMLKRIGYEVLSAGTPSQALAIAKKQAGNIDLLMTDVVMPEMSGRHLAQEIHSLCPKARTLFMSGYTANVIAHNGVLDEGVNFIQKPFSLHELGEKVAAVLKQERPE